MRLADKMFSRSSKTCPLRSKCREGANQAYFRALFEKDWEVFVIRRDKENDKFDWFTLCCEAANIENNVPRNTFSAACC
jgi:hypothetical protein